MTKEEFRREILVPIERYYNVTIVYSGKEAEELGKSAGSALGVAYNKTDNKVIVLKWYKEFPEMLQTLFHEMGHILLHGKGSGCRKGKNYKEAEAETFAKYCCQYFGYGYRAGFKSEPEINYIEYFYNRYLEGCKIYETEPEELRFDYIKKRAKGLINALEQG